MHSGDEYHETGDEDKPKTYEPESAFRVIGPLEQRLDRASSAWLSQDGLRDADAVPNEPRSTMEDLSLPGSTDLANGLAFGEHRA